VEFKIVAGRVEDDNVCGNRRKTLRSSRRDVKSSTKKVEKRDAISEEDRVPER